MSKKIDKPWLKEPLQEGECGPCKMVNQWLPPAQSILCIEHANNQIKKISSLMFKLSTNRDESITYSTLEIVKMIKQALGS